MKQDPNTNIVQAQIIHISPQKLRDHISLEDTLDDSAIFQAVQQSVDDDASNWVTETVEVQTVQAHKNIILSDSHGVTVF